MSKKVVEYKMRIQNILARYTPIKGERKIVNDLGDFDMVGRSYETDKTMACDIVEQVENVLSDKWAQLLYLRNESIFNQNKTVMFKTSIEKDVLKIVCCNNEDDESNIYKLYYS